jgi:hypothetical protein
MIINLIDINGISIAEIVSEGIEIKNAQDALEIIANCSYQGARKIIIREENIIPDFYDLKTRIAGEVLQKFSNYDAELAIVGDFSKYSSKSLRDFIYESNKKGRISFVKTVGEAKEALTRK